MALINLISKKSVLIKGKSISIIKTTDNDIIGGYTSIPWSNDNNWQRDEEAFLFSVTHQQKMKVF